MTSLSQLNESAASPIEVTDVRPAGVIFDRLAARDFSFTITNLNKVLTPQIGINEIVNYSTANVRYKVTIRSASEAFVNASTMSFNSMPDGASLATSRTTYARVYTVSGLRSAAGFNQIKSPTWNIPGNYALSSNFWVESEVIYYDQELARDVTYKWLNYDDRYYYVAVFTFAATFAGSGGYKKFATAAFNSNFDFNSDAPFERAKMSVTARAFVTANGRKLRLLQSTMPPVTATITASAKYANAAGKGALQSAFTVNCLAGEFVRSLSRIDFVGIFGPIGPGGVAYIEGNGYNYPPGDQFAYLNKPGWTWPGINRLRQFAAALNTTATVTCIGNDVRLMNSMVMSAGTMTVSAERLPGLAGLNLTANSTMTSSFRVDYKLVKNLQSTAQVQAIVGNIKQFASNITAQSSVSTTIAPLAFRMQVSMKQATAGQEATLPTGPRIIEFYLTNPSNCVIDWGDGSSNTYSQSGFVGFVSHTYASYGDYNITITGQTETLTNGNNSSNADFANRGWRNTKRYCSSVYSFGDIGLKHIQFMFEGTGSITVFRNVAFTTIPSSLPSTVTDLSYAFAEQGGLSNSLYAPIVNWNTSNVEYMVGTFWVATTFNQNISGWDTSKVKDMSLIFAFAYAFNQPVGSWNVSNVEYMIYTFYDAEAFNQTLNSWNVGKVKNMALMFGQMPYNQPLNNWNTSSVDTTSYSLRAPTSFLGVGLPDQRGMYGMFAQNGAFDQDISMWVVTNIPSKPTAFDVGTSAGWITAEKPNWGV